MWAAPWRELSDIGFSIGQARHVSIEKLPENQREIVAAFARRLDKVPPEMMAELKKIVLKSLDNERPFHRTRRGIVVPPVSTQNLRKFAEQVRSVFAGA